MQLLHYPGLPVRAPYIHISLGECVVNLTPPQPVALYSLSLANEDKTDHLFSLLIILQQLLLSTLTFNQGPLFQLKSFFHLLDSARLRYLISSHCKSTPICWRWLSCWPFDTGHSQSAHLFSVRPPAVLHPNLLQREAILQH